MSTIRFDSRAAMDAADFDTPVAGVAVNGATLPGDNEKGALQFLNALFGTKPAELFILIWLLGTKMSKWFQDVNAAAEFVTENGVRDVYVGVALSAADYGPRHRCKAEHTAGIVAVYVDIDILSDAHKKQNLPRTLEEAAALLPEDLPPSIVVHTGHGIQAWWIFEKPWIFTSAEDRKQAEQLSRGFNRFFQDRAAAKGCEVDSTWDQARVLRIPDTTNTKVAGDHRPVELADITDRRYTPGEIWDYLTRAGVNTAPLADSTAPKCAASPVTASLATVPVASAPPVSVGAFVLDPAAEPPFQKFEALSENDLKFRATWDRKRPDMPDKSASAYDMSLADCAAKVEWTDQEIANLIIAHRRKHGDDLKLRRDYFKMTIAKARAGAVDFLKEQEANKKLLELLAESSAAPTAPPDVNTAPNANPIAEHTTEDPAAAGKDQSSPEGASIGADEMGAANGAEKAARRAAILNTLSTKFRVPLKRIVKFTGDDPRYRLETELGDVQLGNVNGLISQSRLRSSIAAATDKYLPHFDEDIWPGIARLLLEATEKVDRGRDATLIGTMTEWLRAYLRHKQPHESLEEADEGREPFIHNGAAYIFADNFRTWLGVQQGEKVTRNMLTADLRAFGAVPEPFELEVKGKRTTRSAWKLPAGIWEPEATS